MIFSDNVPVADEIALKDAAAAAGVLVMGPDCGTAMIGGVGLGFANVLRGSGSGPRVGVVAASGTGAQQLTCLLDDAGVAVSHVLGVGGRDLSEAVGGRSADHRPADAGRRPGDRPHRADLQTAAPGDRGGGRSGVAESLAHRSARSCCGPGQPRHHRRRGGGAARHSARPIADAGGPGAPDASGVTAPQSRPGVLRGLFSGRHAGRRGDGRRRRRAGRHPLEHPVAAGPCAAAGVARARPTGPDRARSRRHRSRR